MCPNCILNQSPLDTGLYVAFGICVIFFIMAVWAMSLGLATVYIAIWVFGLRVVSRRPGDPTHHRVYPRSV